MRTIPDEYLGAGNPKTKKRTLRRLASHDNPLVRRRVAENPKTPPDILKALAGDSNAEVRAALVHNTAIGLETIEQLCFDADVDVRLTVAEGFDLPEKILALLTTDENPYVRDRAERTLETKRLEKSLKASSFVSEPGQEARLGELLCSAGFLEQNCLTGLLTVAASEQKPLGHIILEKTDLSRNAVFTALKLQLAVRRGQISTVNAVETLKVACFQHLDHEEADSAA